MPSPGGQCHQLKEPGSDFPVIANQSADWCGNPFPLQRPDFEHVTKEKTDCHVAALLAMTEVDGTLVLKLMTLPEGEGFGVQAQTIIYTALPICNQQGRVRDPLLQRYVYLQAMASISTSAPLGMAFTAKAARAGQVPVKNSA